VSWYILIKLISDWMATEPVLSIHKKHIPAAARRPKAFFRLPASNHYFTKINQDKGVLTNSLCTDEE
jgi:hypothetical protein